MVKKKKSWSLYVVRCCDNSFYTGISIDVKRRLNEHNGKGNKGAKYTRGKGPVTLLLKRRIGEWSLAAKVERKVKKLSRGDKERLVAGKLKIRDIIKRIVSL